MKANILSFLQNKITSPKGSNLHTIKFNNMSKCHNNKNQNYYMASKSHINNFKDITY